jgi:hypothetical protein
LQTSGAQARFFPKLREDDRKVNVPPTLLLFCNLVEVMRLRENMILNLTESQALTDIYEHLKSLVNKENLKLFSQSPIPFQSVDNFTREQVNFFDEGSLTN